MNTSEHSDSDDDRNNNRTGIVAKSSTTLMDISAMSKPDRNVTYTANDTLSGNMLQLKQAVEKFDDTKFS
jgi:hypothetical protein